MGAAEGGVLPVRRARVHGDGEHLDAAARAADRGALVRLAEHRCCCRRCRSSRCCSAWWLWRSLARWRDNQPFFAAMGLFAMCYLGLGISTVSVHRSAHDHAVGRGERAASPQAFLLLGTLLLLPIILMYTGWSYWVFRGKVRSDFGHH